jgi:hypothetical protein
MHTRNEGRHMRKWLTRKKPMLTSTEYARALIRRDPIARSSLAPDHRPVAVAISRKIGPWEVIFRI